MAEPYGPPIVIEDARRAAAAALAEARKNGWVMAVAVTDPAGALVYFERSDDTQSGSVEVAIAKSRCAALFKRPTRVWQEMLASGGDGLRVLGLPGVVPVEGGVPLIQNGKIIGAIGLSGGSSPQDGQCARVGAEAIT
jgi:glc operon protein GlcG